MPRKHFIFLICLLVGTLGIAACDIIAAPTPTPIYVTATSAFKIVTNTPVPSETSVLAPTLPPGSESAALMTFTGIPLSLTPIPRIITMTPTFTVTPTDTPGTPAVAGGIIEVNSGTPAGGQVACTIQPQGGFGTIYTTTPDLSAQIGCPFGTGAATAVSTAYQAFERGFMIWVSSAGATAQPAIYVMFNNSTYRRFNDTWREGVDPPNLGLEAPPGFFEPIRGFGKVWRESAGVRDALGWATGGETGGSGFTLAFERGEMVFVSQTGLTYVLNAGTATWVGNPQGY